jgi:NADPH-dependent 2,4-dienoyl-CoA reductase/sulfur reductase-like enzyme
MYTRSTSAMNREMRSESADIVIIGNGIAGLTTAIEARRLAPDAHIVIITDQPHPTINTPALKQFAIGRLEQEQLLAYPPGIERAQRIHVINARVDAIQAQGKYLVLQGGYGFGYGSLLIATGSSPNGMPADLPGCDFDGVLSLHNLQDYLNLRRRLAEVSSAVVVGGGAHAIESVMGLLHYGIEVHWLIRGQTFLSKELDSSASELVLDSIRKAGANIYTDSKLAGILGRVGSVVGVVSNRHSMLPCQLVVGCTGTTPVTTLAEHCSIPMRHAVGILVDEQFRTNVRDIYAAGDAAACKNPQTGSYEVHALWYNAVLQGRTAAAAMTGQQGPSTQALGVPWHATHLGAFYMLSVGNPLHPLPGAKILSDGTKKKYRRMALLGDRLVGYLSLGPTQPDSLAIKCIIDEGLSIRGIEEALLKGDFDARKYFSEHRSRTIREMITSGKLPAVSPRPPALPQPGFSPSHPHITGGGSNAERQTPPVHEASPGPVSHLLDQPTIVNNDGALRLEPATDKLPLEAKKPLQELMVPLPARRVTRNLWSYSGKLPAAPPQQADGQGEAKKTEKAPSGRKPEPENFLLCGGALAPLAPLMTPNHPGGGVVPGRI